MFLLTIVCEMNLAAHAVGGVNARGSSHIWSFVVIYLKIWCDHYPDSDIKFSTIVK